YGLRPARGPARGRSDRDPKPTTPAQAAREQRATAWNGPYCHRGIAVAAARNAGEGICRGAQVSFDRGDRVFPGSGGPAVDRLDLQIADGEFLVLVGPSG